MTFDKLVATDLAALARDSRAHPRPIAESLRELGLARETATVAPSLLAGLSLVRFARAYVSRVARMAVGAMLLAFSIGFVIALANPMQLHCTTDVWGNCDDIEYNAHWLTQATGDHILIAVIACVLATYAIAAALAARRFERVMERHRDDPDSAVRGLLLRIDGWSTALGIAGPTAFVTMFGVILFTLGAMRWDLFWLHDDPMFTSRLRDLAISIPIVVIAAVAVGRSATGTRARILEHWRTIPLGLLLGLVTLCVGFELDEGHISNMPRTWHPSSALRTALTITGTLAVFVTMAGFALWRRRREHVRCGIAR